ncbi:hypothetical protein [Ramlibacter tataouinensis]|nr:hypothetical protein [Ramlibacter tataouinensis]
MATLGAGCASSTPADPNDTTLSLVYGYIDGKDAKIDWVEIKQYGEGAGYYQIPYNRKTGVFFSVSIEQGAHQVFKFGNSDTHYMWSANGRNATALKVDKPGAYFMGSYKFVRHDQGFFKADKFEMRPAQQPTEAEVLAIVMRELETDAELTSYVHQRGYAKARLAQLGGRRA